MSLELEFEESDDDCSSSSDENGFSDSSESGSFDSDFDPEALQSHGHKRIQTPRPSLTELQGILSKLNLDEEFMLDDVKMDMEMEKKEQDMDIDSDIEEEEQTAKSPPPSTNNNQRRASKTLNDDDDDEKKKEVKHTDSLSAIKVGKKWYINQYLCYNYLGKGAFGKVALAKDITTNIKYAIKVLNKSLLRRKRILRKGKPPTNMLENIFREIAIMKKLDHPNVLQIYEVIDDPENDKLFMVIDYMDNGSVLGIYDIYIYYPCTVR